MKIPRAVVRGCRICFAVMAAMLCIVPALPASATEVVFSTGFERAEGYSETADLEGQVGWLGTSPDFDADNGLLTGVFLDLGQHAYIGFNGTPNSDHSVFVWRPINLAPIPPARPVVRFSVVMAIVDSTDSELRDRFSWTAFNVEGDQLFSLDFDNDTLGIDYFLDGHATALPSGYTFENDVRYDLEVVMDFAQNRWAASLNDVFVVTNQPITEVNAALNFGDIDAVWFYRVSSDPGDNYMVFDDYSITSEPGTTTVKPRLTDPVRLSNGDFLFSVLGEAGRRYAVETTTTFSNWTALQTNTADNGRFDFRDRTAAPFPRRFYRARLVP